MRVEMLHAVVAMVCLVAPTYAAESVVVTPEKAVIVLAAQVDAAAKAAEELQKHLKLITGTDLKIVAIHESLQGRYPFYIGLVAPKDGVPLAPEEARWLVAPEATYLYGEARSNGVRFAVYGFLEDALGVRWIMPEDRGISYTKQKVLSLSSGAFQWAPELKQRVIRPCARPVPVPTKASGASEDGIRAAERANLLAAEVRAWQLRMRMGSHEGFNYGHAFTTWWKQYAKDHPDYFAMCADGKRRPESISSNKSIHTADNPMGFQNIKLCPSNPAVAQQIIRNWVDSGKRQKYINVCENDSPPVNFCTCPECRALDVLKPDEPFGTHLTDRYIHLVNAVARQAKGLRPDAWATTYAYNETEQPPRRERVDPNVTIVITPTTLDLRQLEALFRGWKAAGAAQWVIRPNLTRYYQTTALPIGCEKQMFDGFQAAYRNGVAGADYDRLMGHWAVSGISDYILARAFIEPKRPFEHWESHYCAAYGPAASDVRDYFRYWRTELWERRLLPDLQKIVDKGRYFNFARGLVWSLSEYYRTEDFDRTDLILQQAGRRPLSDSQAELLRQLVLANEHARLVYNAVAAKGEAKFEQSLKLREFREKHLGDFAVDLGTLAAAETAAGDVTGVATAERLKRFDLPWIVTPLVWRFRIDPEDIGVKDHWQATTPEQAKSWDAIRTDFAWENQCHESPLPSALREKLKNYDGIAWYATPIQVPEKMRGREICLYFGAVDESCRVYINGQEAGGHLDDWKTPFTIRIDPFVDWRKEFQQITVRVEDKAGNGGIWRPVWLVSKTVKP